MTLPNAKADILVNADEYITTFVINRCFDRLLANDLAFDIQLQYELNGANINYSTNNYYPVRVFENEYVGQLVLNRSLRRLYSNDAQILKALNLRCSSNLTLPNATVESILLYENEYLIESTMNRVLSRLYENDIYLKNHWA